MSLSSGTDEVIPSNGTKVIAAPQISPVSGDRVSNLDTPGCTKRVSAQ